MDLAAKKINEGEDSIDEWWNSQKVQNAREKFCKEFAWSSNSYFKSWVNYFFGTFRITMKIVILCGGLGTRISEETVKIPKPMVKIGNKPIMCHIIDYFSRFGFNDFLIAIGYKKEKIEEYFHNNKEYKNINIIDTGEETLTGGRVLRLKDQLENEKIFL